MHEKAGYYHSAKNGNLKAYNYGNLKAYNSKRRLEILVSLKIALLLAGYIFLGGNCPIFYLLNYTI